MKYISNAKYGEPVETGTIYRNDKERLDICDHTQCGNGETQNKHKLFVNISQIEKNTLKKY